MIFLLRRIQEHRPVVVLTVLVTLSLLSLVTETQASLLRTAIERVVDVTAFPFLKAGDIVSRSSNYAYHFVADHGRVFRENSVLRQENQRLMNRLAEYTGLRQENDRLRDLIGFSKERPEYDVIAARIIQSSEGILTIDRGRVHGLKQQMPVVTNNGVVGIITEVGDILSKVATLYNPQCRVGAMVRRNRLRAYDGVIAADESNPNLCTMRYIDLNSDVRVDDEIVTSPESVFPTGYPIGNIISPPFGTGPLWRTADVRPYVDPFRLDEVLVLVRAAVEPEAMVAPVEVPQPLPLTEDVPKLPEEDTLPDARPLQERYAP